MSKIVTVSNDKQRCQELRQEVKTLDDQCFQLKNLIDTLPGDVYWKDKHGIWLGLNQRCLQNLHRMGFIKYPIEAEVLGKTDYDIFDRATADGYRKHDLDVMSKLIELTTEEITQLPSGEQVVLLSTKKPLLDKQGQINGIVGNTVDITYLKKIEHDLQKAKIAAEAAARAKTEFIANMSHDIRTPLTGVIGISDILEQQEANPEIKQYARDLHQCGAQLLAMLNSVLDVVSADHVNDNDIFESTFDLKQCIDDVIAMEKPTIDVKKLTINSTIDPKIPPYLVTDRTKLHRILLNLVGNAIKFTDKGAITIDVSCLSNVEDRVIIRFSVTDTGIGISDDQQKYVFERFFRATPSYKGQYEGHGVGLHIAQSYAELLGGKIKLASQEAKGSTFFFELTLPIGKIEDLTEAVTVKSSISTLHRPCPSKTLSKLLLIEDNPIVLAILESMVQNAGFHYVSCMDGEAALETAKNNTFDLIITDIGLPGISGNDFAKELRDWEKAHKKQLVPIIALTAHAQSDAINAECLQSGINSVLTKPITLETLCAIINQYLATKSLTQPNAHSKKINTGRLGVDLPDTEAQLFELDKFPLLDVEKGLSLVGNDKNIFQEILLDMITREIPTEVALFKQAFDDKNWDAIEKLAHKMKGGAAYTGTEKMKFACQYLERYRKAGHTNLLEQLYQQMLTTFNDTHQAITQWLQKM